MKWLCIEKRYMVVTMILPYDPNEEHPDLIWMKCPEELEDVISEWVWWLTEDGTLVNEDPKVTLAVVKDLKGLELRQKCQEAIIISPFTSSALGSAHNYDCREIDQNNIKLRYAIASGMDQPEPIWASDGTRYSWKDHTAEELLQVMVDMNNHIKTNQVKLAGKLALVDAATTKPDVGLVSW